MTVDDLVVEARGVLRYRPGPAQALAVQARGALLVDIRSDDQCRTGASTCERPAKRLDKRTDLLVLHRLRSSHLGAARSRQRRRPLTSNQEDPPSPEKESLPKQKPAVSW
jgi:hypothetical protein